MVHFAYLCPFDLRQFVGTGTHLRDTLAYIAPDKAVSCSSIDLAACCYQFATQRFASNSDVTLLQGDGGKVLPEFMRTLRAPTLFWLDGHYSGGIAGRGELDTPVSAEVHSVLDSPIKDNAILIDDVRLFDGTNSYPHLHVLLNTMRGTAAYHVEVSADIIQLTPMDRS